MSTLWQEPELLLAKRERNSSHLLPIRRDSSSIVKPLSSMRTVVPAHRSRICSLRSPLSIEAAVTRRRYSATFKSQPMNRSPAVAVLLILAAARQVFAAAIVIDAFEVDEGHFFSPSNGSGTTSGIVFTNSTMERITDPADVLQGVGAQRLFIDDDTAVDSPDFPAGSAAWRLRHLSGGGTPANNLTLDVMPDGYVGYYLKTLTLNLQASIYIDDGLGPNAGGGGGATERGIFLDIIPDGEWHLYQWQFSNADQWEGFAGTGFNGQIDNLTVTIDGLLIRAVKNFEDQDAVVFIDNVIYDSAGPISVIPEPSSVSLVLLGVIGLGSRRRRP
jgi:hypothetical protein